MSEKLTAEEYSESEMFLKSILNSQIAIAMTPSDLAIYKKLVAKEAVEKFAEWITQHSYQWFKEIGEKTIILWRPLYSNNKGIATEQMYSIFLDHQAKQKEGGKI